MPSQRQPSCLWNQVAHAPLLRMPDLRSAYVCPPRWSCLPDPPPTLRPACCLPECGVNFQSSKSTDHSANLQECSQCTELPISSARRPCLSHPGHRAQRCKNDWPDSVMQSWRPRHGGHDGGRGGDLSKDDAAAPAPALTPHPHTHTPSRWTPPVRWGIPSNRSRAHARRPHHPPPPPPLWSKKERQWLTVSSGSPTTAAAAAPAAEMVVVQVQPWTVKQAITIHKTTTATQQRGRKGPPFHCSYMGDAGLQPFELACKGPYLTCFWPWWSVVARARLGQTAAAADL